MTMLEAAATLGLSPDEITPEAVERSYREKAKQCHPDTSSAPDAETQFKQVAAAYETLSGGKHQAYTADHPEVIAAAEAFQFTVGLAGEDVESTMSIWQRIRGLAFGFYVHVLDGIRYVYAGQAICKWSFQQYLKTERDGHALLAPPIDCEILDIRRGHETIEFVLTPLNTSMLCLAIAEIKRSTREMYLKVLQYSPA